jgi:hypothetical protein
LNKAEDPRYFPETFNRSSKKEKSTKKERNGRLVESAAPEKIAKGRACGDIFPDDFHRCLENPAGFSTATAGPAAK